MQCLKNIIIALTILLGLITFAQSETSWIKKKDKTDLVGTIKKVDKEKTTSWIKKKEVKENKKKFNEKNKNISNDVKSWITKKSKEKYITFESLPINAEFYFVARNEDTGDTIYGYINSKKDSFFEYTNFYKNSEGLGFIDDGKTVCKIGSEITAVAREKVYGEVHVNCGKIKFNGDFAQSKEKGSGTLESKQGEKIRFDFYKDLKLASNSYEKQNNLITRAPRKGNESEDSSNIKPTGKYYALLIGNSNYNPDDSKAKWASLKSPVNDVKELSKILKNKYKFEVITVLNANRKKIFQAFNKLSKMTTDNDYVLIYYSGHGDIVENSNMSYWIPIDAEKEFGMGDWINIRDIEVYLENKIPAHHLALLVDSCYFAVGSKGGKNIVDKSKVYKKLLDRRARLILASGSNEPVNDDSGSGKHSKFAKSIIQSLKNNDNVIALREIGEQVFLSHDKDRQQPYHVGISSWGHGGGDLIFVAQK